jgi:hypothetical protein
VTLLRRDVTLLALRVTPYVTPVALPWLACITTAAVKAGAGHPGGPYARSIRLTGGRCSWASCRLAGSCDAHGILPMVAIQHLAAYTIE